MSGNRLILLHLAVAAASIVLPDRAPAQEEPPLRAINREATDPASQLATEQRSLQIAAATAEAGEILRRDVLSTPFDPEFTIEQMVRRLDAQLAFTKALQSADQLGSPRWRPEGSCEVRMVLAGGVVADALAWAAEQAHVRPKLGASARQVRDGIARLRQRTFIATGVSAAAGPADHVRPAAMPTPWRDVPPQARASAVDAARNDAASAVMDGVAGVSLGNGKTLGDALQQPDVADSVRRWFAARPLSDVEYRNDLKVRVMLAAPADELWPVVRSALMRNRLGPAPEDDAGWERVRGDLERSVPAAEGRGVVASTAIAAPPATMPVSMPARPGVVGQAPVRIPVDAPMWATRQIEATAVARETGLRGAHAAQSSARSDLREQLIQLPLTRGLSVGSAATADPRVERAIADALQRARVSSVRYLPDQVEVTLSLDLELLWRPLSQLH
jgi:hypothetical protein